MGFEDPDHHHPLNNLYLKEDAVCFRCELPFVAGRDRCYGCTRCNHFVHKLCFGLPENMKHPHHPEHSLTILPSPISSSTTQINCNQCLEPFVGGYAYHCQSCLEFNLHLKCFRTLNLETKHNHPLSLWECYYKKLDCRICGLLIDHSEGYAFACVECEFFIHFECTFLPPTVKHRHVHELTFEYNHPKGSKIFDCDVCLGKDGDEELDRTLSYYYCEMCDYIAHVRCVTSEPDKVTTQFDQFIHEHPMLFCRNPYYLRPTCSACQAQIFDFFYFCGICNYALHKSCVQFPRFIKHPGHEENHTLSLQSCASQNKDCKLVCCEFCTKELGAKGWIFQCSDCEFAVHFLCARKFEYPLYEDKIFTLSFYKETDFRCNACGELGGGFRMSNRDEYVIDLHVECFSLPGHIAHGCHSHLLYLVNSPTEIQSDLPSAFQCDICHTETDPEFWVYCCIQCKYIAHLKCVVSDLLPATGLPSIDFSNVCFITMSEKEKFRVRKPEIADCLEFLKGSYYMHPGFLPRRIFFNRKVFAQSVDSDVADSHKSSTDVLRCPKCEKLISTQAYLSIWDWVHRNLKASMYKIQTETPADNVSLALLGEKVVDELYCPICNLLIFPPTYSCADCQIFFHKSCAELPRKYTVDGGHTLVLQSPSIYNNSFSNCSRCKHPYKAYAYVCTSCEMGIDVTCALGAPLLKLENHKHILFASSPPGDTDFCNACNQLNTGENIFFKCGAGDCRFSLHIECALLPHAVKHRIHEHPLVLEPHLDLSVDDYICDVCEKELNPCIWVYRCSDICSDRATSHVSCIVTSNKKCHFVYDEECTYPHIDKVKMVQFLLRGDYTFPKKRMKVAALAAAIVSKPHLKKKLLCENLFLFLDELEHDYADLATYELMEMGQAEVFHLMESSDALSAKVAELVKDFTLLDKEENAENDEDH